MKKKEVNLEDIESSHTLGRVGKGRSKKMEETEFMTIEHKKVRKNVTLEL